MKKILIFSHAMELGGAERALLGLLETIDTDKYEVDLFLMRREGELLKYIPGKINILPQIKQYSCLAVPFSDVIKKGCLRVAYGRYKGKKAAARRAAELELPADNGAALEYSHKYTLKYMPAISDKEYDCAVSFLTPHYFVSEKVKAKKKIAWIHTDYSKVAVDTVSEAEMWNRYDNIISISQAAADKFYDVFKDICPEIKDKIRVIPNILPMKSINAQTEEFSVKDEMTDDGSIKLLSIGRFCTAKNFDNVPDICKRLAERGLNVKWYLIGFGADEELIKQKIKEYGMESRVIILGKKANPYPYIKACDIYVQPSRYEGRCVSVVEAQMLHKPVIITAYETSKSQLENGVDGLIVPLDNEGCADGIAKLINDDGLKNSLINNTMKRDYSESSGISALYSLI